jgi:pimeloyl-ACP methyl ester carboxylesterase
MAGREDTLTFVAGDGAEIVVRRLPKPDAPRLVFCHGNGFAIDGYRVFWEQFAADYELVRFDLRNHGRNPCGPMAGHTLAAMAEDHQLLRAGIDDAFGVRPTAAVFHSVSSIAALRASLDYGTGWDALLLLDPPLIPEAGHPLRERAQKVDSFLAAFARNRPRRFERPEQLAERFRSQIGEHWVEGAELDMARAVTRAGDGSSLELCCPPEYEAAIYLDNAAFDSVDALASLRQPGLIIGSDPALARALPSAIFGPEAAARHGQKHVIVPGTRHMLPIEEPAAVATIVREFLCELQIV